MKTARIQCLYVKFNIKWWGPSRNENLRTHYTYLARAYQQLAPPWKKVEHDNESYETYLANTTELAPSLCLWCGSHSLPAYASYLPITMSAQKPLPTSNDEFISSSSSHDSSLVTQYSPPLWDEKSPNHIFNSWAWWNNQKRDRL